MDQPRTIPALPGTAWGDRRWLLLLLLIASALRLWQLWQTEVPARDSVIYIRLAWRLEHEDWRDVCRTGEHHPGYPVAIWLVARAVRPFMPDQLPQAMCLSAQLAAALAGVLLVVPSFYLGKALFDARVGFWGALLFQCLPESGQLLVDGLSEPLFLLLAAAALVAGCRALATADWRWFALTGLASAAAYLTRTEGLLVALATGLLLVVFQLGTRWKRPRPVAVRNAVALTAAALLVAAPFMLTIGGFTRKASFGHMFDRLGWRQPPRPTAVAAPLPLASWNIGPDVTPDQRRLWAAWKTCTAIDSVFYHVLSVPVLLGLWLYRRRFAEVPAAWLLLTVGVVLAGLVYWMGVSAGYLGGRHVLLIGLGGLFWAVAGVAGVAAWLSRRRAAVVAAALLLAAALGPLPRTLGRLHGDRVGFKQAGEWLATHAAAGDRILDPFAWSRYHAGRVFTAGRDDLPRSDPPVAWVVVEESRSSHSHLWYLVEPAKNLAVFGELVQSFEVRRGRHRATVKVYRVPLRFIPDDLHPLLR